MNAIAYFNFYGSLNDFLHKSKKQSWIGYHFKEGSTVKDAIEAMGIPHVEVAEITMTNNPLPFSYRIQEEDKIEVWPYRHTSNFKNPFLSSEAEMQYHFILDVHLGKLAGYLRLLGFDAVYQNDYNDCVIAERAYKECRIVLTRDIGLLKHKVIRHGYWLRSQQPKEQLKEVIKHFYLQDKFLPFTRCLCCNGIIRPVSKDAITDLLPLKTRQFFQQFFQCISCKKVYWKGSHVDRMMAFIEEVKKENK